VQSVFASNNYMNQPVRYVPVPIMTMPEPNAAPRAPAPFPPPPAVPGDNNLVFENAFSAPRRQSGFLNLFGARQSPPTSAFSSQDPAAERPQSATQGAATSQGPATTAMGGPQTMGYPMGPSYPPGYGMMPPAHYAQGMATYPGNPMTGPYMGGTMPAVYRGPLPPNPYGGAMPPAMPYGAVPAVPYAAAPPAQPWAAAPYANPAMDRGGVPVAFQAPATVTPEGVQQMVGLLRTSLYPSQREWAADYLAGLDWRTHPEVLNALVSASREDPAPTVRAACALCLGRMNVSPDLVGETLQALKADADPRVRQAAETSLARFGPATPSGLQAVGAVGGQ
jgi:hypothetical protein